MSSHARGTCLLEPGKKRSKSQVHEETRSSEESAQPRTRPGLGHLSVGSRSASQAWRYGGDPGLLSGRGGL